MSHPAPIRPLGARALLLALLGASLAGCERTPQRGEDGHDHPRAGASSDVVALSSAQLVAAGVEVAPAGPGLVEERLTLTAVVRPDLDAQAHITPKVPGLVRAIRKQLGERVSPGEVVCELESTELGLAASRYREAKALLEAARAQLEQEVGLLERKVALAETIFARESRLKEQQITTLRPFYEAERALNEAKLEQQTRLLELRSGVSQRQIALHTAEEQLHILGLDDAEVARLADEQAHSHGLSRLRASRAGVIVARDVTENEFVDTADKLFLVQDLSRVWVVGAVYEQDLRRVTRGLPARVRLDAFPDLELRGEVTFLQFEVARASRAAEVRIELPNEPLPGWPEPFPLRPGMFGTVELVTRSAQVQVAIPEEAVVHEGERAYVFVQLPADPDVPPKSDDHDDPPKSDDHDDHPKSDDHDDHEQRGPQVRFQRRVVTLGARDGDAVEVTAGLAPGERVVIRGAFTLKSLARQGELGGGHSH